MKVCVKMLMKDIKLTMDAIILDDCDTDTHGLQQATEFIKGIKKLYDSKNILPLHLTQNGATQPLYCLLKTNYIV